jgi:hypothetical protein
MRSFGGVERFSADVRRNCPVVQVCVIRVGRRPALKVVPRVLVASLLLFAIALAVAAARPDAGPWAGPPASAPGARATVRFTVDAGTGLVQPVVRYRLRRCDHHTLSGRVTLGLVAVRGRRFEVVARHRAHHARVRLKLTGRFDSSFQAHGDVRGRVRVAGRRCRIPRLSWTAEQGGSTAADEDEPVADEDLEDGEELELDDFDENDEPIEEEEPAPDDEDPGEGL